MRRTAESLSRSVPFESYRVATLDPKSNLPTGVFNGGAAGEEGHSKSYHDVLASMYFDEDLKRLSSMVRNHRTALRLSEASGGVLELSRRYREYLRPVGLRHELAGLFSDGGIWGAGYLTREAGEPDFDRAEVSLLGRLAPQVGAGLKAAALRSRASGGERGPGVPGVLTLDRQGRLLSHTPTAERLLSEMEELTASWTRDGVFIPVSMVAAALERRLKPASDRDLDLVPQVRVRGRSWRWLTLHASLTEPTLGRPSETIVVIAPSEPEEVARLNVACYGLTPCEEELVKLVARGLSTREISGSLFISEHTFHNHLRSIFEKAGVHSRTEMVQRLYFEGLSPGTVGG